VSYTVAVVSASISKEWQAIGPYGAREFDIETCIALSIGRVVWLERPQATCYRLSIDH
jgi:hypothetical protein